MALPEVGLQAVISGLPAFNAGAKAITNAYDTIEKRGQNVAKASNILGSSISSLSSPFVNLGQNVLKFGAIAGGAALLGVTALTAGVVALGASALTEVSKYERMSLSIQNLVAREISQGQVVEQQRQVLASLTAKETKELEKLKTGIDNEINDRDVLSARIQEQKQRIIDLTAQYGEQGLVVIKERAELQGMELDLVDLNGEISTHQSRISELTGKEGQLVNVMEKVRTGQMSMTDAMTQAGPRAQELLKWIQLLAIQSPFSQEGVADAFRTALAYGFTTEQAKRLTETELDFASATGKGVEVTNQIALALGQMQAKGKVSGQEIIQLTNAGVGVNAILGDMGFNLDDVSNGLVNVDDFIESVIKDMEIFRGAGRQQSETLSGLTASLEDLKSIGLREFFTGTFNAIRPYTAEFVGFLTNAAVETGSIKALGETLGQFVGGALEKISGLVRLIQTLGMGAGLTIFTQIFGPQGIALWMQVKTLITNISTAFADWGDVISTNLSGPMSDFTTNIIPAITQGLTFINDHFEEFKGALVGIGAVLAVGVFAALVAGILALLTPINLIIVGAALLGAAWAGNWGGIQEKTFATWAVIQPVLQQIADWLGVNIPIAIKTTADLWTTTLQPAVENVANFLMGTWFPLQAQWYTFLGTTLVSAIQTLSDLWTGTLQPALTVVGNYIQTNLFPLMQAFNSFLLAIFNKTIQAASGLWQNVLWPALNKVWGIISSSLQPIFEKLSETVGEEVSPFLSELGETILPLLSEGLETVTEWIKKATDFFNGLASAVSNFELPDVLNPHSPPPFAVALQDIANAANVAASAISTLNQGVSTSSGTFADAVAQMFNLNSILAGTGLVGEGRRHDISSVFRNILPNIIPQLEAGTFGIPQLMSAIQQGVNAVGGVTMNQVLAAIQQGGFTLQGLVDDLNSVFSNVQQALRLANAARAVGVAGQFAQFGQAAAQRLADQIDILTSIVESGEAGAFQGQIISATQAQELLNAALEDQASVQMEILDLQRQQADLQWLQQQISLIQMVRDAGLNVADIFQGITFGLDASIPDIIAATNAVVQAMIDQVDADLAIQSPSRVMFEKFKQVGEGAVAGIMATKPMLQSAITSSFSAPVATTPVGNSYTTNNYFDMTVPTQATPQGVIRQFEIARAMIG